MTGAADDDPAGIGTYSHVGAAFRFDLVWTALVSLPLASAVQETAARLGLVSGRGLMSLIKDRFSHPVLWLATVLVVGANTFNIGADLGSMAEAFRLLVPIPFALVVVATAAVILLLEVFVSYDRYSLILRWLALSIFAYVLEPFVVNVDWSQVVAGLIPSFHRPFFRSRHSSPSSARRSRPTCSSGRRARRSRSGGPTGSGASTLGRSE